MGASKKLTPKMEAFAQAYVELGNASEAYRRAYNAGRMKAETIVVNASRLLKDTKVTLRVEQLQAKHAERHDITVDSLTAELEEARSRGDGGEAAERCRLRDLGQGQASRPCGR